MHHQLSLFDEPAAPAREYKPQTLRPYQHEAADATFSAWQAGQTPLLALATGSGKALATHTKILTPDGYKRMGDITTGDYVIGSDGCPTMVIGVFPQGERDAFRVTFSDGANVVCDADHIWSVRTKYDKYHSKQNTRVNSGQYRQMTTREIMSSAVSSNNGYKWFIPVVRPIAFKEKRIVIDPYLVGALIGDGGIGAGVPVISSADDEILNSVRSMLPDGVIMKHSYAYDWRLSGGIKGKPNPLTYELRKLGLWGKLSAEKFIPPVYLYNSTANRISLLQGLMDTDGYINKKGLHSFSTASQQLATDVKCLVESLGGIARITHKKTTHQISYRLHIALPNDIIPFRLTRKLARWKPREKYLPARAIASIEPFGKREMVCIAVDAPDSLYVIDHAIVTHNTTILADIMRRVMSEDQQAISSGLKTRRRALILAHTEEIIFQLAERVQNQVGNAARVGIVMADQNEAGAQVVVATRQSLYERRLSEVVRHGIFDYVLIDECHHATLDSKSYGSIIETVRAVNPDVRIAGFTATPKRTDKKALGSIFTDIAYEWLIPEGIKAGYLVPVRRLKIATQVDLSGVKTARGDYSQSKMMSILDAANWLQLAVDSYLENVHGTGRKCIAFLPRVKMSQDFADALRAHGVHAEHIDGETPKQERRVVLNQFRDGEIQCISNVAVLTEGFDAPSAGAIFLARPTRSEALFTQIIGRGLRPYPGKQDCLLVDLSVTDTKALQTGTLLGRMVACHECGTEYHFGFKACPTCGAERPKRLDAYECECGAVYPYSLPKCPQCGLPRPVEPREADRRYAGAGVMTYEQLFEGTFAAWHHGEDGYFSCTMSFDDGSLVIAPPRGDEELFRLLFVPKDKGGKPEVRDTGADLVELMLTADALIEDKHLRKDAGWRDPLASEKQRKFMASLGIKHSDDTTKGQAAALITHKLATKQVAKFLERKS